MLRKIRIALAAFFFILITLMFLDFTGTLHCWFGWMAKVQLIPAVLAINVVVIVALLLLTFIFGRIYCSVVCPLGVMQDVFSWIGGKFKKKRFKYQSEKKFLRYGILILFILLFMFGFSNVAILIAPYSIYGRIAANLFSPVYQGVNSLLALFAERADSYAFYSVDIWIKSVAVFTLSAVMFVLIGFLAVKWGRTWCNTICPVGTFLGIISKYSLLKPCINHDKCSGCGLCARNCKASCIDSANKKIDYSRCVACMDCMESCHQGAITFCKSTSNDCKNNKEVDSSKRNFLTVTALLTASSVVKSYAKDADGGLAVLEDKKVPERAVALKPAGSVSFKNFSNRCTACQLCVSACPNNVLRPSTNLSTFMQPEMSYENGYCHPDCTKCSDVCPSGAIKPVTKEEKSSIQVGHALWVKDNCVVLRDGVKCGNCARHCPTGAIKMVKYQDSDVLVPAINEAVCIGCGACEYVCPARPFSAIYVDGHEVQRVI